MFCVVEKVLGNVDPPKSELPPVLLVLNPVPNKLDPAVLRLLVPNNEDPALLVVPVVPNEGKPKELVCVLVLLPKSPVPKVDVDGLVKDREVEGCVLVVEPKVLGNVREDDDPSENPPAVFESVVPQVVEGNNDEPVVDVVAGCCVPKPVLVVPVPSPPNPLNPPNPKDEPVLVAEDEAPKREVPLAGGFAPKPPPNGVVLLVVVVLGVPKSEVDEVGLNENPVPNVVPVLVVPNRLLVVPVFVGAPNPAPNEGGAVSCGAAPVVPSANVTCDVRPPGPASSVSSARNSSNDLF